MKPQTSKSMTLLIGLWFIVITGLASATPITAELFYTRYNGSPRVKKVHIEFDGTTFTLGTPVAIGNTPGADGLAQNPQNPDLLIVGGQGSRINSISKSSGTVTSVSSPVGIYHLEVTDPNHVFGSAIPGPLARHPIAPDGTIGPGTWIPLSGDDGVITQLITTPDSFYYTQSAPSGYGGSFGKLTFTGGTDHTDATSATTTRLFTGNGFHGGTYDPFSGNIITFGDNRIVQIDPLTDTIVSDLVTSGFQFDQGTVDGNGHLFIASNNGKLFFMDYSASRVVGDSGNFIASPFLDSYLDDLAPLVGAGGTQPPAGGVPEPASFFLLLTGLATLRLRRG